MTSERVIARTSARRAVRPGALWGLVFGATIAASASTYVTSFPNAASRATLAQTVQGNVGFTALFGPIRRIDTVAGYTAYKSMYTVLILGAIWGLFIATKLLRGEEDTGRWDLLLSGPTTRARAAHQVAFGLGVGLVALWVPTALLTILGGAPSKVNIGVGTALFCATALVSSAAMFMAVGMVVSQLAATRHDANVIGAGVIAGSYLVRMVADSDPALEWLRWASPFGWIEELRPLTGSRPNAFVPIVVFTVVLVVVASRIAARRDAGSSALRSREGRKPRLLLLGGQAGLTIRLTRGGIIAWSTALAATGLCFGLVTQAAGNAAKGSETLERVIARLGARGGGAIAYLGYVFLIAAGIVAIAVAGQISAIRNEESAGHLDNLLVRSVPRWRWLAVRLAVGAALVVGTSVLTGFMAWVGAATQHSGVGLADLLEAGLNVAPPALFVLGIGALVFGLWPRAAIAVTYGVIVWSFLVETIAAIFDGNQWLKDTSPFLHIRPAPAVDPNWNSGMWLIGLGLVAGLIGVVAFMRRDLVGA